MVSELEKQINRQEFWRKARWIMVLACIVAAAACLILSGCYTTPAERDAVKNMPESTPEERGKKREAWAKLDLQDSDEDTRWEWGTVIGSIFGLGTMVTAAWKARKDAATLDLHKEAIGVLCTSNEKTLNLLPEATRDELTADMGAKQDVHGVREVIHRIRKPKGAA